MYQYILKNRVAMYLEGDCFYGKAIPDAESVRAWAREAVNALSNLSVLSQLSDLGFDPGAPATRANVASMLYMYLISV